MLPQRLFRRLEADGIPYCVLAPTAASTLIDLLVDRRRADDVERALAELGCRRLRLPGHEHGVGAADWLGLDHAHAPLRRLRTHYRLPLHRGAAAPGRLPWEHAVLAARRPDAGGGCQVADPERALLGAVWQATGTPLPATTTTTAGADALAERARALLGEAAAARLPDLPAAARAGLPAFAPRAGWRRSLARALQRLAALLRGGRRPVLANGGLSVAFVGCDGSGKSTVTRELASWLAPVLRVDNVYLGSGEGSSSLLRWPLLLVHRLLVRRRSAPAAAADTSPAPAPRRGWRQWLRPVWALALAREKRLKLAAVWRARHDGALIICDRYPQNEIMGFNDGPLLSSWGDHRSRWRRALSAWERRPYQWAQLHPPDLVVKLRVSEGMARRRKPDMTAAEVARRVAAVDTLRFGHAKVLDIDADAPLEQVLERVKTGIWAEL